MNIIKAITVEDERASRDTLRNYLHKYCPEVELVAEASNVMEGRELILQHRPELLFLDVEMPYGNGFDLIEALPDIPMEVVFITAYSDYAVRALNMSASYYLLKPIDIDELVTAVSRVLKNRASQEHNHRLSVLMNNLKNINSNSMKITLPTMEGFDIVDVREIVRARANDNLTDIYLSGGTHKLVCKTLKFFEETLNGLGFIRVHKSHLINMDHVQSYRKGQGGTAIMSDGAEVEISVRRKSEFLNRLG